MTSSAPQPFELLDRNRFCDPDVTASGAKRASVAFQTLKTLWFNTGTLCNLTDTPSPAERAHRNVKAGRPAPKELHFD